MPKTCEQKNILASKKLNQTFANETASGQKTKQVGYLWKRQTGFNNENCQCWVGLACLELNVFSSRRLFCECFLSCQAIVSTFFISKKFLTACKCLWIKKFVLQFKKHESWHAKTYHDLHLDNVFKNPFWIGKNHVVMAYSVFASAPNGDFIYACLLYTSPSPRDATLSRMPSSA